MTIIKSNINSLFVQNKKQKNESTLNTAIQRLSSGLRINSAKDDAAGQSIANRFTAQQRGSLQAARNANDGISLSQTTQGYLDEINARLQRVRELTVQGLNGSYTPEDKDQIQTEINLNFKEIERINDIASFNGIPILNGQAGTIPLQVGANDGMQIPVDLGPPGFNIKELGLVDFTIQGDTAKTLTPIKTIYGASNNIPIYSDKTTVTYAPAENDPVLVKRTPGSSQLFQVAGESNRLYNVNVSSQHDTDTLDNNVRIVRSSHYNNQLRGDSLSINSGAFIDQNGQTLDLPNQRLVHIQGQYWVRTATDSKEGPFTYYKADVDYSVADTSTTARISRIQLQDGIAHSQADLGTSNTGDSKESRLGLRYVPSTADIHSKGTTTLVMQGAPVDSATHRVVNLNGQYFIEKQTAGDYEYYRAAVEVKNHGKDNQEIIISSQASSPLQVEKENFVTGNSTIHLLPENKNVQVDYIDQLGVRHTDVMRADQYGDYVFHLHESGDGTAYKRATVVKDQQGNYYLKTIDRGEAELYLYYPIKAQGSINGNGSTHVNNNKTVITFREGPEVVRFRTPEDPLATLDRAIARVDAKRSQLGALDHRLDAVITQQIEHSTHLTAAKSRIEDADYALEVVNLTRAQILQQVSVTTLAQSNLSFQSVLALLR